MEKSAEHELDAIINVIKQDKTVKEIYLFGSFAYGNPNESSDFDIYVVIADNSERPLAAMQKFGLAIAPFQKRPVDLLVGSNSSFEKRKLITSSIEHEVAQKGVKLYA